MSFSKLGLSDKVLAAVTAAGYTTPTPIQEQAIPHVLARRDVLGIAQTGTGKTAAFTLPMLTMLENGRARARMPRTLILEPTRELAAQVEESFDKYGANHKLNVALMIGGVSFDDQDAKLTRGVDVLIATPGRLLDHFERGRLLLTGVELLVIDEADRMLDMGFIPDIERICKLVPFTRQTLFFTATMPPEIRRITEQFLHNPVRVEVSRPATTVATITQLLVKTGREPHDKRDTLRRLIRAADSFKNAIIFCNRKREVATLHRSLVRHGFYARGAARRHGPVGAHGGAGRVPQGRGHAAGRLRRRRARPRHSRRQPRLQFRRAASSPTITSTASAAPAAPARTGTAITIVGAVRQQGGRRDREADRPEHSLDGGRVAQPRAANAPRQPSTTRANRTAARTGTANRMASSKTPSSATVNTVAVVGTGAAHRRDATAFRLRWPASMTRGPAARPSRSPRSPLMPTTAPDICRPSCCAPSASRPEPTREDIPFSHRQPRTDLSI